jgi:alpha-L-arabinofuranosidase
MDAHNTFEKSDNVAINCFKDLRLESNHVKGQIPSKSVVLLEILQ